jgi:hypothetical protein
MTAWFGVVGAMLKEIQVPLGDQSGCSRPNIDGTTWRSPVPSVRMT